MPEKCAPFLLSTEQKQSVWKNQDKRYVNKKKNIFILTLINSHIALKCSAFVVWVNFLLGEKNLLLFYFKTRKMIPPFGQESSKQLEWMSKWVRS